MRTLGAIVFPEFELLDLFGPLEMFGMLPEQVRLRVVAERPGVVASKQGPKVVVEDLFEEERRYDLLLLPGGRGTRREVDNPIMVEWLRRQAEAAEYVATVCTGSAVLARTGLLDERRATTNKAAFRWVTEQGPAVRWRTRARWVLDGKFFTSSGVSAGMDMALGLIAHLFGEEQADQVAVWAEYSWQRDPDVDPFSAIYDLS